MAITQLNEGKLSREVKASRQTAIEWTSSVMPQLHEEKLGRGDRANR